MSAKKGNWIVRRRGEDGALARAQIVKLSEDFGLPEADVQALSTAIAYPLSPEFLVGSVVKVLKQQDKGGSELDALIKNIRQAEVRLDKAAAQIDKVQIGFPNAGKGLEDPNLWLRENLHSTLSNVQFLRKALERSAKKYFPIFTDEPDNRKIRDERQLAILFAIFNAWEGPNRKVTVTTHPLSSERYGPLVDFTNAVVSCITDPVTQIKGETVWQTIKEWRSIMKLRDQVERSKAID